jgi:hypothetical protein
MKTPDRRQAESGFEQMTFLPKPKFNPHWPNRATFPGEALERMLAGERLTQPTFGLTRWRLSAYIKDLDYMGWPIQRADVPNPHGQHPIRQYWLDGETIRAARGEA